MRYDFGDLSLDTGARRLRRGPLDLHLSPKAFDLLSFLVSERPRVIPHRELYDHLWPATYVVDGNLPVLIGEIRRAMDDADHSIIRTVHNTGYAFARELSAAPSAVVHLLIFGNREFALSEGQNVIGRDDAAGIVLPSKSVSRRHAIITVRGDTATVVDLASKNGTFIDTKRLAEETPLADGNVIRFGAVKVFYRRSSLAGSTDSFGSHSASNS